MTKNHNNWLLIDYDDTLGGVLIDGVIEPNYKAYDVINERLARDIAADLEIDVAYVAKTQHDIDTGFADLFGFEDKTRFARSWVATYERLSGELGRLAYPKVSDTIYGVGMSVFDFPYVPLPGALDALAALSVDFHIAVVTKGNKEEQFRKVVDSGVLPFADRVFVPSFKNMEEWTEILSSLDLSETDLLNTWAIGNSAKSDVNPPVSLGTNGIHIEPMTGWSYEHAEAITPMEQRRYEIVCSITDVPNAIYKGE
jgi:FMN phosphatase YigB (HAD superfamily)